MRPTLAQRSPEGGTPPDVARLADLASEFASSLALDHVKNARDVNADLDRALVELERGVDAFKEAVAAAIRNSALSPVLSSRVEPGQIVQSDRFAKGFRFEGSDCIHIALERQISRPPRGATVANDPKRAIASYLVTEVRESGGGAQQVKARRLGKNEEIIFQQGGPGAREQVVLLVGVAQGEG